MRLSFYRTLTEALGFGALQYEKTARQAWLALALTFLLTILSPYFFVSIMVGEPVTVGTVPPEQFFTLYMRALEVATIERPVTLYLFQGAISFLQFALYAAFFVPLLRYAGRGEPLPGTSFPLTFGFKHLRFIGATYLSAFALGITLLMPMFTMVFFMMSWIAEAMSAVVYQFPDENSLHTVEEVSKYGDQSMMQYLPLIVIIPFVLAFIYFQLRVFAYPAFVTLHDKADGHNAFLESWRTTRGWGVLKLLLALLALGFLIFVVQFVLNLYILPLFLIGLNAAAAFVGSATRLTSETGGYAEWVMPFFQWLWVAFTFLVNIAVLFFQYGTTVGLNASLYRQRMEAIGETENI